MQAVGEWNGIMRAASVKAKTVNRFINKKGEFMGKNDRYVVKHDNGWAVKKPGAERASSLHSTQHEAERSAKNTVANLGGGEVRIQGRDGQWRDSDTVPPGNDPMPPRDRKH